MSEVTQQLSLASAQASRALGLVRSHGTTVLVAAVVFLVAYENGGYGESTRDSLAIALWWLLVLAIGLGLWPLARTPVAAVATGGLIAAFGAFTLISTGWAADAAGAYAEFTRVALYLAVFVVAVAASRRDSAGRWCDGLSLGIVAVTVLALVSRFFPHTLEQPEIAQLLGGAKTRLSYPVGYWNGLGILLGLGVPLLLRTAVLGRTALTRGLALAPLPALSAAIYLTSSRTGVLSTVVGTAAFILLTARRWSAVAAIAVAGVGSAAAVFALYTRDTLVNGPLGSSVAESQGRSAALIVAGICILTGLLYGIGHKALAGLRPSPAFGWILLVVAVAAVAVGITASHPVRRFEEFKSPNVQASSQTIQAHLFSSSGNSRWQLWSSAVDEFESRPWIGRGAGSYYAWWAQHGSVPLVVQDAHSLYAEVLGELGIIGFLLLVGAFVAGLATAATRLRRVEDDQRVTLAAAGSAFLGYAVAAAADWIWELPAISVVAFACLGLATGPATAFVGRPRVVQSGERPVRSRLSRYALGVAVIVAGWLLICAIAIPLLAGAKLNDSRDAAARGDVRAAIDDALSARSIQPWSTSPYLQVALVEEQAGAYGLARSWLARAIRRDRRDWKLWYVAARIDTERGAIGAARRDLARAQSLNPRSPLFAGT